MQITCKTHNTPMKLVPAGVSRRTNKPYPAFYGCTAFSCKETMQMVDVVENVSEDPTEAFKRDLGVPPVEEEPMKRVDWDRKEFIKGLAVFSSNERSQGMSPVDAAKASHTFDWMYVAYGDNPNYAAWAQEAKARIQKLASKKEPEITEEDFEEVD